MYTENKAIRRMNDHQFKFDQKKALGGNGRTCFKLGYFYEKCTLVIL